MEETEEDMKIYDPRPIKAKRPDSGHSLLGSSHSKQDLKSILTK